MYKISIYGCAMFKKLVCQWVKQHTDCDKTFFFFRIKPISWHRSKRKFIYGSKQRPSLTASSFKNCTNVRIIYSACHTNRKINMENTDGNLRTKIKEGFQLVDL